MTCITQIRITMVPVDSQSCKYIRSYPISYHSDVVFWVSVWFYSQFLYVKSTFILLATSFLSRFIRFSKVDLTRLLRLALYMCLWRWQLWCLSQSCAIVQSASRCPLHAGAGVQSHKAFVTEKRGIRLGVFYFKYFGFPLSLSVDQSATLIHLSVIEYADVSKPYQLFIFSKYKT